MNKDDLYDMSGEYVKLNIDPLIDVAAAACRNARCMVNRYLAEIDDSRLMRTAEGNNYHANHSAQFNGKLLVDAAKEYAMALQAYHALVECKTRSASRGRDFRIEIITG